MSDLFHDGVPFEFIKRVFATMTASPRHTFQVLTKRSGRLREVAAELEWPPNVWMGVSVEDQENVHRIEDLEHVPAAVRFLSIEPLLGPIQRLPLGGIHWVIVGGESGPGRRPMAAVWASDIRDQCLRAGVPFFFKQWGGRTPKAGGRLLDGQEWDEMPLSRPTLTERGSSPGPIPAL